MFNFTLFQQNDIIKIIKGEISMLPSKINENIYDKIKELNDNVKTKVKRNQTKTILFKIAVVSVLVASVYYKEDTKVMFGESLNNILISLSLVGSIAAMAGNAIRSKLNSYRLLDEVALVKRAFENKVIEELNISRQEYELLTPIAKEKMISDKVSEDFVDTLFPKIREEVKAFLIEEKNTKTFKDRMDGINNAFKIGIVSADSALNTDKTKAMISKSVSRVDSLKI